jgi:hypothetical protein
MKKYMWFILSVSMIVSFLEGSHNLPVVDNKASKSMIAAALIAVTAVPSYLYYRSSSANQKEAQKITQEIKNLRLRIGQEQDQFKDIENGTYSPLPKEYQERKKAVMELRGTRASSADYQHDYAEFQKFITKFSPPVDAQADLIENEQLIYNALGELEYNKKQDRFHVKSRLDFDRILNVERMKKLINQHHFKHITVPNKYIFFIGDGFLNIADKIKPYSQPYELISKDEIEELANFVEEIGYSDFTLYNLFKSSNGKWVFIDTENNSFKARLKGSCRNAVSNLEELRHYLLEYSDRIGTNGMAQEANIWLNTKINNLETALVIDQHKQCSPPVVQRTDLDDADINMEAVKRYADDLEAQRTLRSTLFGIDPFDQKINMEAMTRFKQNISDNQEQLKRLETKLASLKKTWYARIRDSWSNFWSTSRATVVSWRWW